MSMPIPHATLQILADIKGRAVSMGLPAVERRNLARREALLRRITSEFVEMPGLALTIAQASRFLGLPRDACERVLARLTHDGVLYRNSHDLYVYACRDRTA
jgi:hypothetical protein